MSSLEKLRKYNYLQYPYQNRLLLDMPGEIWKPVTDYENYYEVSNYGRIKSIEKEGILGFNSNYTAHINAKILSQQLEVNVNLKTLRVNFCVDYVSKDIRVRDIVYRAFIGDVNLKDYNVIHLDGDGENCMAENLGLRLKREKDRKKLAYQERLEKQGWTDKSKPYQNMSLEDMEGEVWKPMLNYETHYMVSNLGRIKSIPRKVERILRGMTIQYETRALIRKQEPDHRGNPYLVFGINTANNRRSAYQVAYAVYTTFIGLFDFSVYRLVYVDGDTFNNRIENLKLQKRVEEKPDVRIEKRVQADIIREEKYRCECIKKLSEAGLSDQQKSILEKGEYPFMNLSLEDMEGEVWRKLPFYEDYIEVSNLGRIKRLSRLQESKGTTYQDREMIAMPTVQVRPLSSGMDIRLMFQLKVTFMEQGRKRSLVVKPMIAKAVYSAFVKPVVFGSDWPKIHFKDGDRLNVRLDNLEGRHSPLNNAEKRGKLALPKVHHTQKKNIVARKVISRFGPDGKYICTYSSIAEAGIAVHLYPSSISSVRDKPLMAGGYFWRSGNDMSPISEAIMEQHRQSGGYPKRVEQYTPEGKYIATYSSISEAACKLKCSTGLIHQVLHRKCKLAKGFVFKWAEGIPEK